MREDFFVGAGKGEFVKLTEWEPLMGGVGMRVREAGPVDFEGNAVSSDGVFDDAKWLGAGAFEAKPAKGSGARPSRPQHFHRRRSSDILEASMVANPLRPGGLRPDFGVRKFPQLRINNSSRPLANEEFAVSFDNKRNETAGSGFCASAEVWNLFLPATTASDTQLLHGANVASWISRRAEKRAEFHQ